MIVIMLHIIMENAKAINKLRNRIDSAESYQKPYRESWDNQQRIWESIIEPAKKLKLDNAGRSALFVPYTFSLTEWIIEDLLTKLIGIHPLVKLQGVGTTPSQVAVGQQTLVDLQLHLNHMQRALEKAVRQMVKHGNGALFNSWNPNDLSYTGCYLEWVSIYDLLLDSKATSFEDCDWVVRKKEVSYEWLYNRPKSKYKDIDKVKKANGQSYLIDNQEEIINKSRRIVPEDEQLVQLYEEWDKNSETWKILANKEVMIKESKTPFNHKELPFSWFSNYKREHVIYDKGDIELLEDSQNELNASTNLIRDSERLNVSKLLWKRRGAMITNKDIENMYCGKPIEVTSKEDFGELAHTPLSSESYNSRERLKQEMNDVCGAPDPLRGAPNQRQELATTMSLLRQGGQVRGNYKIGNISLALCNLARQIVSNNYQFIFMPLPQSIFPNNTSFQDITEMYGEFLYIPELYLLSMSLQERRTNAKELYKETMNDPFVNPQKRLDYLLDSYEILNKEEWFSQQPQITAQTAGQALGGQNGVAPNGMGGNGFNTNMSQMLSQAKQGQ